VVLGIVLDGDDRPIAQFLVPGLMPGNSADVTTLTPVVKRLQERFAIKRACTVADLRPDRGGHHRRSGGARHRQLSGGARTLNPGGAL
jgi:hypothetical protein